MRKSVTSQQELLLTDGGENGGQYVNLHGILRSGEIEMTSQCVIEAVGLVTVTILIPNAVKGYRLCTRISYITFPNT